MFPDPNKKGGGIPWHSVSMLPVPVVKVGSQSYQLSKGILGPTGKVGPPGLKGDPGKDGKDGINGLNGTGIDVYAIIKEI